MRRNGITALGAAWEGVPSLVDSQVTDTVTKTIINAAN